MSRSYSLAEIDAMRQAIDMILLRPMETFKSDERERTIEMRLRTYLAAGIDPEELIAKGKEASDRMDKWLNRDYA